MDSINKNQPEKNHANISGQEAVERIKKMVEGSESCFFCTATKTPGSSGTRPMAVQQVDDEGHLWFLSAKDSHKNLEIAEHSKVDLFFQGSKHSEFLHLTGRASLSSNRAKIKELWKPLMKTWFTEGMDDPRISVIEVTPSEGYYWDNKHGDLVAGLKMAIGATAGVTLDDSIEGKIKV